MRRRSFLIGSVALSAVMVVGTGGYKTPPGDRPIEVFIADGWVEYEFDELCPGDIMRCQREPLEVWRVESYPVVEDLGGVGVLGVQVIPYEG